jgi:phage I-like protein
MPTTDERQIRFAADLSHDSPVLSDGTMWSHAAELRTFRYGKESITIDKALVENCIRVFKTGCRRKINLDYEHGSTGDAADTGQPVPAAGQVKEMRGVYSPEDFTGELKATAERLAQKVGRSLDDPRNMGLWIRWEPTARALQMVTAREYTELSITMFEHFTNIDTGEDQGPTIVAVALTNLPHLDGMLPVAARRRDDHPPASGSANEDTHMPSPTMLQRAGAFFGRVFSTEDEVQAAAEGEITTLRRENESLKSFKTSFEALGAEVGETDTTKIPAKVRELKAVATAAQTATEEQTRKTNEAEADKILLKHEKRLTPAQKDYFKPQLVVELKAGIKPGETKTEKVIESFPENQALQRKSAADGGQDAPTDRDARITLRANELLEKDPTLKRMAEKDEAGAYNAFKIAVRRASSEIPRDKE